MSMLDVLITALLIGLFTFYLTNVMVYNFADETSNNGPLKVKTINIYNTFTFQARPANLFDLFRMLTNFYEVRKIDKNTTIWEIKEDKLESVWSCPHCLGFWVAAILTFFLSRHPEVPFFILTFGGAAGVSSFLNYAIEALEHGKSMREVQPSGGTETTDGEAGTNAGSR